MWPMRVRTAQVADGRDPARRVRTGDHDGRVGSGRPLYACFLDNGIVVLAMVYGKNEQSNLTAAQRKGIAAALRTMSDQLRGEVR